MAYGNDVDEIDNEPGEDMEDKDVDAIIDEQYERAEEEASN
jgi:hypothetical protein